MKKKASSRRVVPRVVAAVVHPVSKRLSHIEGLLFEMRHVEDVKLKRLNAIEQRLEEISATVSADHRTTARLRDVRR